MVWGSTRTEPFGIQQQTSQKQQEKFLVYGGVKNNEFIKKPLPKINLCHFLICEMVLGRRNNDGKRSDNWSNPIYKQKKA